jgi:protein-disulfide isomerase
MVAAHDGAARVDAGNALATKLHAEGTPTSFINGVLLTGAQGPDKFSAIIDAELAKGRARLAAGMAPDKLYATLATENWKVPQEEPDDDEKEDTTTVWNVPVVGAPVRGVASAPVTIVEFSDYQCPYCKRVEPALKQVVSTYGDKVRIVWRDEPLSFHPRALPAAELAREARAEKGEAGFWAAHDALFDSQPALADSDLDRIAKTLGLDAGKARSAIDKSRYQAQIDRDGDLADDLEASGTPHFFVNGRRLVGAQPFEKFAALIDEELHHADALVAKGTPPGAVYETIIKAGKGPPPPATLAVQPRTGAPWKGSRTGKVVIEEFADFQCPFCARAEPTLQRIAKDYGTQVKFVWRNLPLPFHAHAMPAAEAAAEAQRQKGNAGFWAMHDKLFAHQGDHDGNGSGLERAALETYAGELGLDLPAFKNALDNHTHKAELDADHDAVEAAHIEGAPTFVVGGYVVGGAQPYGRFRRIIEQVLASGPGKP